MIVVSTYYARFLFPLLFFSCIFPFLSPYIESIWSSISSVFSDVFASPMWAELNDVKAPSLCCLAEKLPEIVLGSRADSTTLTYLNGFKRWRAYLVIEANTSRNGSTDFPKSQCCLLLRLMFLYTCSVFSRLLVLLRRCRTPSIAFAGFMILLISPLLPIIHFARRSWSPLREGYYTKVPKSSPLHQKFHKSCFRVSMVLWWTQDSWPWHYWPLRGS